MARLPLAGFAAAAAVGLATASSPQPVPKEQWPDLRDAATMRKHAGTDVPPNVAVKAVVCSVVQFKPDDQAGPPVVREALIYRYTDGKTVRLRYTPPPNAQAPLGEVLKTEVLEAYPTPLADEELKRATDLAREKDEKAKALPADSYTVTALVPVVSDRKARWFARRIVHLTFVPKDKEKLADAVRVTVDLTDGTIPNG